MHPVDIANDSGNVIGRALIGVDALLRRVANSPWLVVFTLLLCAFVLRLGVRIFRGEGSFWGHGYVVYYNIATNLLQGDLLCLELNGLKCAHWPPVYPFFLAVAMLAGEGYLSIVILQSLVSMGTVLCVFLLGKELFGEGVGLLASLFATLYPYYVWHDTSLQETNLFAFLTLLAVWLLYLARRRDSKFVFGLVGVVFGLAVLTKATLLPFLVLLFPSMVIWGSDTFSIRLRRMTFVFVCFVLTVGPWLIRNHVAVGAPVFTTITGRQLWIANNPYTFTYYPGDRIDFDEIAAWEGLTPKERARVDALSQDEMGQQDWFMGKGVDFIVQNPRLTTQRAITKVLTGFSWRFSPAKDSFFQGIYFGSYFPILTLAAFGIWMDRKRWRDHLPIYLLFLGFAANTAVFHAHTSHRVYLDVYLIMFAAFALLAGLKKWSQTERQSARHD